MNDKCSENERKQIVKCFYSRQLKENMNDYCIEKASQLTSTFQRFNV